MKKLAVSAIGTGSGTLLYTVPTGMRTHVVDIMLVNTGTSTITGTLHFVPTGGSATTSNMFFPAVGVDPSTSIQWTGIQALNAGDFIQGIGSASGLTIHITGEEVRAGT